MEAVARKATRIHRSPAGVDVYANPSQILHCFAVILMFMGHKGPAQQPHLEAGADLDLLQGNARVQQKGCCPV